MKSRSLAEKLLIQEIGQASQKMRVALKGLSIGTLIKFLRTQLGMSQKILANRAKVPQSTISRIELSRGNTSLSTLRKVLGALSCDLVIAPLLQDSIDRLRQKQARKIAEKHVNYLKGTMHLENQQPDFRFVKELLRQEEERLLQGSGARLWEK
jgi:transcriptional regulator with XRE-family HTH domain